MRWVFMLVLFLGSFCHASAQSFYIKGRVTDGETNQPLKGASVYINNSTRGAIADDGGEFSIGPLVPGKYEVVASFVGYGSMVYVADIKTGSIKLLFELEPREKPLREVLILTEDTRQRYLEIFKRNVLGYTSAAQRCRIKNIDEVQFASGSTKDELQAYADKELVIENPDLGYTIRFELVDFYYNRATTATYFYGFTRYEDWAEKDSNRKQRWERRRKRAFEGSTIHFFRSLIQKQMAQEGFTALQLMKSPPPKFDTARDGSLRINVARSGVQMAQRITEENMLSLYTDSGYKVYELHLRDGWRIDYKQNTELKAELAGKEIYVAGQPARGTTAGLRKKDSAKDEAVLLSERGVLITPMHIYFDGIWAYERLANMLPDDYEPQPKQ